MSAHVQPLITIADLDALPDDDNRYEIIEGELFVSRAPELKHQETIGNFYFQFRQYLTHHNIGRVIITPGVTFNNYTSVIPDLVFISNDRTDITARGKRIEGAPDIVIEIVSPGAKNSRRDRIVKRQTYAKFGVREYWIADAENQTIEIYRLQENHLALIETLRQNDDLATSLLPDFKCRVADIFQS